MANDKNTFIVYSQWQENMDGFPDDVQNEIRKAVFFYAMGRELPKMSPLAEGFFWGIKCQMDANTKRYEEISKKRSEAGRKSGEVRTKQPKGTNVDFVEQNEQTETKGTNVDFVEHNDNVNVNDNDTQYKCEYIEELSKNQQWQEQICMNHHIKSIDEVKDWLGRFELDIGCNGTVHNTLKDAMSHFNAWLKKELKNQNKTTNGNKTGRRIIAPGEIKDYGSSF